MAAVVRVVSSPYDERSESVLEYNAQTPIPAPIVHIHSTCSELGMLIMTPTLTTCHDGTPTGVGKGTWATGRGGERGEAEQDGTNRFDSS